MMLCMAVTSCATIHQRIVRVRTKSVRKTALLCQMFRLAGISIKDQAQELLRCQIVCCRTAIPQIGVSHMNKSSFLASTAIGILLCIVPANAQMQQKGSEEKAAPQQGPAAGPRKEQGPAE